MFLALSVFVIVFGIISAVLILRSEKKGNKEIERLASEFEITEIDA